MLTALELHAELVERSKAVPSLSEFFDNAANFDKFTRGVAVLPSCYPSMCTVIPLKSQHDHVGAFCKNLSVTLSMVYNL